MYSKGPWVVYEQGDADEYCLMIRNTNRWLFSFRQNGEMSLVEQRNNAKLIAHSPSLLKVVKELVAAADGEGWKQLDPNLTEARQLLAEIGDITPSEMKPLLLAVGCETCSCGSSEVHKIKPNDEGFFGVDFECDNCSSQFTAAIFPDNGNFRKPDEEDE